MKFYFTFMGKQAFKNHYVEIEAADAGSARTCMFAHFGDKFMTHYPEEAFLPQIEEFGLRRLARIVVTEYGNRPGDSVGYHMEA